MLTVKLRVLLTQVFLFLIVFASSVNGQVLKGRLNTVAGELKIAQLDEGELGNKFTVTLDGNVILKTDGDNEGNRFFNFPVPSILRHFKNGVRPFNEVVLFQQNMWGNACNGGPLWFLGLNRNGSFVISSSIDFCGGRDPVIREGVNKVTVIILGGPPNRGRGYIPGETYVYQNGEVRQIRNRNRRG